MATTYYNNEGEAPAGDQTVAEWERWNGYVQEEPDKFEAWEGLIRASEALEGGLSRTSSPEALARMRSSYDRLLAKFPLFFGYWKKYADIEFSLGVTETAELVYERGVSAIPSSVDLWTDYCTFKIETNHDESFIRELFERGSLCVGLDFLSHKFWDKYIEFEEQYERVDNVFKLLRRIIIIPLHQYARYFEKFTQLAANQAVTTQVSSEILKSMVDQVVAEKHLAPESGPEFSVEMERELRVLIHNRYLEVYAKTQSDTMKRWQYESEITRSYFHVTPLDQPQLVNFRRYLDFEESEGDFERIRVLYERLLVPAAYYDEFWFRYVRWMSAHSLFLESPRERQENVANIYRRAAGIFVPIGRPFFRVQYAIFEESEGAIDKARSILEAECTYLKGSIEPVIALANFERRTARRADLGSDGCDAAIAVYKEAIDNPAFDITTKGALVAEWARVLWRVRGDIEEARNIFQKSSNWFLDSWQFWIGYLKFEIDHQMSNTEDANENSSLGALKGEEFYKVIAQRYPYVSGVHYDIRFKTRLPPRIKKDLSHLYMDFLLEIGGPDAAAEYVYLDSVVNGSYSVQTFLEQRASSAEDSNSLQQQQVPPAQLEQQQET